MPIMVERPKWILYKHTNNFTKIKLFAWSVKYNCATRIDETNRHWLSEDWFQKGLYSPRNKGKLDAINHRINTLEYFMFGYEHREQGHTRFMFSPLGNLFLKHIEDDEHLPKIFTAMLFAIQFQHPANNTPACFQLFPFRLIFSLLLERELDYKLYFDEYV